MNTCNESLANRVTSTITAFLEFQLHFTFLFIFNDFYSHSFYYMFTFRIKTFSFTMPLKESRKCALVVSRLLSLQLLLGFVANLLLGSVGPESGLVEGIQCALWECVTVVLHGHLFVWQQ